MPRPVEERRRYMPGLDGLRAIAVLAVIAYHLDFGWAEGGLLGVGVFFTLSGYLITDILLTQVNRGGIRLQVVLAGARPAPAAGAVRDADRRRRLGDDDRPAPAEQLPRRQSSPRPLYFNNWWLIFHNVSYFARFAPPGPLNHLWSLSIEEQFYIVWPFLLLLGAQARPRGAAAHAGRPAAARRRRPWSLALVSAILMAVLYHPSLDPSRVYYGTDTRAFELLFGAALAMVWPSRNLQPADRRRRPQHARRRRRRSAWS